ncbi:MAG: hypothetical protein FH758_15715 [Firmicutes bacterium]|nr:hypothetical protein [Bacillota bacterium]
MRLPKLIFFNYRTLAKVLLFIIPLTILARVYWPDQPVEITFSALRWPAEILLTNQQDKNDIVDALKYVNELRQPGPPEKMALYKIAVQHGKEQINYLITEDGEYFTTEGTMILPSYRLREQVKVYLGKLERQSPYGQLLTWQDARQIFSRYTKGTVEDLDTGLRFNVQRRAGDYHADVQPLTSNDTEIMKEIYNGQWSWRRRAVIIEVGNTRLAASMSGYPHGAGAIRHNNFDGHFCIHFKDSTTHQSPNKTDLAHQIMVWKAAGRQPEMFKYAQPEKVAEVFLIAVSQHASDIALSTLVEEPKFNSEEFDIDIKKISNLSYELQKMDLQTNTLQVNLRIDYAGGPRNVKKELELKMVHSMGYWWKIDPRSITKIFAF